jgi:ABC-type nickel/cobalt efflux system permease component RcnA
MLGLDAKTLSVPDYEITARLERLITVVQPAMAIPLLQLPSSTTKSTSIPQQQPSYHNRQQQQQQQHHHHHHQPTHSAHGRRRSPSPVSRRTEANHRARSLSPLHVGIDPRTY